MTTDESPTPGRAAMNTSSSFARLRATALACLHEIGAPGDVRIRSLVLVLNDGEQWPIPFFDPPELDDVERVVVEAIERAGEPLQQKEIARAAKVSIRLIQNATPRLVERGLLVRHPSLGFYLPGMHVTE